MKIIDLTKTIESKMDVYPGDPEVKIRQVYFLEKQGWRLKLLSLGSHTGTHVDAPAHMVKNGKTLDKLQLDKFIGKAMLVKKKDKFPKNIGLAFYSGKLNINLLDKILRTKPPFIIVGDGAEMDVELERKLLENGIITFGNVVNLNRLPKNKPFIFYGIPLKINGGDGSLIRAFAILD